MFRHFFCNSVSDVSKVLGAVEAEEQKHNFDIPLKSLVALDSTFVCKYESLR